MDIKDKENYKETDTLLVIISNAIFYLNNI